MPVEFDGDAAGDTGSGVDDGSSLVSGGPDSAAAREPEDDIASAISSQIDLEKSHSKDDDGEGGTRTVKRDVKATPIPPQDRGKKVQQDPSQRAGQPPQPGQKGQPGQQGQQGIPRPQPQAGQNAINPDGTLVIGGQKFKDLGHVAQVLHTQHERAAAESRGKEEMRSQLEQAVANATEWQRYAQHWQQQVQGGQGQGGYGGGYGGGQARPGQAASYPGAQPQPGQLAPDAAPKKFTDRLNQEAINFLTQKAGTPAAMQYLAGEVDSFVQEQVQNALAQYEARMQPVLSQIQGFQTDQATITAATQLWMGAAQSRDEFGNLLYPELSEDRVAANHITSLWKRLPPELAYSADGVRIAYLQYQDQKSRAAIPGQNPYAVDAGVSYPEPGSEAITLDGNGTPRPGEQLTASQRQARAALAVFRAGRSGGNGMDEEFLGVSR